jgi:hypothetical protein
MSGRRFAALTALVLAQTLSGTPAGATEGGASLYIPGLLGPGAGIVPPPGFYFSNVAYSYSGGRRIQVGGILAEVEAQGDDLTGTWVTPVAETRHQTAQVTRLGPAIPLGRRGALMADAVGPAKA